MNIKILIQLLLFIILISTAATYYYFYKSNEVNVNVDKINSDDEISVSANASNVIINISYSSTDDMGNKYNITMPDKCDTTKITEKKSKSSIESAIFCILS